MLCESFLLSRTHDGDSTRHIPRLNVALETFQIFPPTPTSGHRTHFRPRHRKRRRDMHCGGICSEKKVRTHVRVLFLVAVAYILLSPLPARAAEWNQGDRTHKYSDGTNNWIAHGYMTVGNATFIVPPGVSQVEVLVVAGGGGGGVAGTEAGGGGGGGGGVVSQTLSVTPGTEYPITVGAGGKGGDRTSQSASRGANGGNSSFGSVVANGGGGGGGVGDYNNGAPGGS